MTITSSNFSNVNVGTVPNDGTGDPLRTSFTKINENFQYINEKLWPNLLIDPPSLTTDIVSSYISDFNLITASQILVTKGEGNITANTFIGNMVITNYFDVDTHIANVIYANSINGVLGNNGANAAFVTNLTASGNVNAANSSITNTLVANTIVSDYLGSIDNTIANIWILNTGNITAANLFVVGNITTGPNSNISGFHTLRTISNLRSNLTGTITLGLAPVSSNNSVAAVNFGNSSSQVLTVNYGSIVKGTQRTMIFQNNVNSLATRYIVLPNSFNNKGTANILIPSAANAMFQFTALESDAANVFCFIANN